MTEANAVRDSSAPPPPTSTLPVVPPKIPSVEDVQQDLYAPIPMVWSPVHPPIEDDDDDDEEDEGQAKDDGDFIPTTAATSSPQKKARHRQTPEEKARIAAEKEEKRKRREAERAQKQAEKEKHEKEKEQRKKDREQKRAAKEAEAKAKKEAAEKKAAEAKAKKEAAEKDKAEKAAEKAAAKAAKIAAEEAEKLKPACGAMDKFVKSGVSVVAFVAATTPPQAAPTPVAPIAAAEAKPAVVPQVLTPVAGPMDSFIQAGAPAPPAPSATAKQAIPGALFHPYTAPVGATWFRPWERLPATKAEEFETALNATDRQDAASLLASLSTWGKAARRAASQRLPRPDPARQKRKLLMFAENGRPPFRGPWTADSAVIRGRRPLAKDPQLEYGYDSGIEWDKEPSGDELGSDDEAEPEEKADDEDEDDPFVVPDGHLSADEGIDAEEHKHDATGDPSSALPEVTQNPPVATTAAAAAPPPAPRVNTFVGVAWDLSKASEETRAILGALPLCVIGEFVEGYSSDEEGGANRSPKKKKQEEPPFPEAAEKDLVDFIRKKKGPLSDIIEAFQAKYPEVSGRAVDRKIRDIAVLQHREWREKPEIQKKYPTKTRGINSFFTSKASDPVSTASPVIGSQDPPTSATTTTSEATAPAPPKPEDMVLVD